MKVRQIFSVLQFKVDLSMSLCPSAEVWYHQQRRFIMQLWWEDKGTLVASVIWSTSGASA